jgi:hypothetical protein
VATSPPGTSGATMPPSGRGVSTTEETSMRRTAVLSGLVLVGGVLGPSTAFAGEDGNSGHNQNRWIAVEDHFTVVLPDGQTFTGDAGPLDPNSPPAVGTRLFISEALHATDDGTTPGDVVGRSHIECTAQVVEINFLCDAALVFDRGSQLTVSVDLDFSDPSSQGEPFDIAVTGGTNDFFGATGQIHATDVSTSANETVTLYEADLVLPHR